MPAYIDPTSGGLMVQLLFAGLAGVGVFFRTLFRRFFQSRENMSEQEEHGKKEKNGGKP